RASRARGACEADPGGRGRGRRGADTGPASPGAGPRDSSQMIPAAGKGAVAHCGRTARGRGRMATGTQRKSAAGAALFQVPVRRAGYCTLVPNCAWLSAGSASGVGAVAEPWTVIKPPAGGGLALTVTVKSALAPAARAVAAQADLAARGPPAARFPATP